MKRWLIFLAVAAVIIGGAAYYRSQKLADTGVIQEVTKRPEPVTVQTVAQSRSAVIDVTYPGTVSASQETTLNAAVAGNVVFVAAEVGRFVTVGSVIAKIDDTTGGLTVEDGWKSAAVQQAQIAEAVAKKNYGLAKRTYATDKSRANKISRDIAKLQYENAQIALQNVEDSHTVRAPFAGFVTTKSVDRGDAVSIGQPLVTLSQTGKTVARFFVDQRELAWITAGQTITIVPSGQGSEFEAKVSRVNPQADAVTRRFLVEVDLNQTQQGLRSGTVVTVHLSLNRKPENPNDIIVPLSVLTTGQNETYLFTNENGSARKHVVTLKTITGEWAEVATDLPAEAQIVVDGSKRVQDGSAISVH